MGMRFPDRPPMWHHQWWSSPEWIFPMLILVLLLGVAVWAIIRMSDRNRLVPASAAKAPGMDTAIEHARLRYAGGEIDRETFLQLSRDLTAPGEAAGEAAGGPATDPTAPAS